jgi:hypothetical protein
MWMHQPWFLLRQSLCLLAMQRRFGGSLRGLTPDTANGLGFAGKFARIMERIFLAAHRPAFWQPLPKGRASLYTNVTVLSYGHRERRALQQAIIAASENSFEAGYSGCIARGSC